MLHGDRIPSYRRGRGTYEREFVDDPEGSGGTWTGRGRRPSELPNYLLPACTCGWRGPATLPYVWKDKANGYGMTPGAQARSSWSLHVSRLWNTDVPDEDDERVDQLAQVLGELTGHRPRAVLALVRRIREITEQAELQAVAKARAEGVTWGAIASDLGQARQSVHARYTSPSQARERLYGGTEFAALVEAIQSQEPEPARDWRPY